ncbi:hypothetical protein Tel_05990 [Candidatus Tenderia electrophaga]|jgi:uncharacterized protein YbgA (DUF1722 family)/uncharacterized protein YbbK (DUF523 family)|uniref:DUF1722 domain-containing protein n=1 Tax=Candidatus Tenderia electrophaga TaxID=1748243 RepID=A0A0S2TCA0_9GAMM|nr:hypothetical protein Tel_05990 [Candidatus Tenderia electrophaga]
MEKIRLGVSSCLLGHPVRFDGGHKHQPFITATLAQYFDVVPLCPELAIGLGVPRQSLRLVGRPERPRVIGNKDPGLDVTDTLADYGREVAAQQDDICGYIVKKDSPSCGMARVRVYVDGQMPQRAGVGAFTRALMAAKPWLPVEEEGRLNDAVLRENFFERVYVCHRWQRLLRVGLTPAALVRFHTAHKYLLMSRAQDPYRQLGRMVARAGCADIQRLGEDYFLAVMTALKRPANRKRHSNVLYHLLGYFKRQLPGRDRQELAGLIEAYRRGRVPLVVPVTLLKHHLGRNGDRYLAGQYYFDPYPPELSLRNSI